MLRGFSEISIELMEPQNQVRVETLFPDFCFQVFLRFSYVDCVGAKLPYPPDESTSQQWSQSGKHFFFLS